MKLSQLFESPDMVNTPAFKAWFGNSKVVDKSGNPLRVYHGTGADFAKFDLERIGASQDYGNAGAGFYFMDDSEWASAYADDSTGGAPNVIPVYLSLKNPKIVHYYEELGHDRVLNKNEALEVREKLIKNGHDGVIVIGTPTEYVAFHSNQIKSAIGNQGKYDAQNDDITESTF